jgi:ParB-like chromosome segregation protein Spo0J
MELLIIDINLIKPTKNLRNYNKSKYYLYESIRDYGFINPILIDENYHIISGNLRYKIAKELNLKSIPCVIINELDNKQVKEYKILDNHIQELSGWDYFEKKKYILDNHLRLNKYELPEDYDIDINIDDFFEKSSSLQISLFDLGED